jgi:hypothetical protein
MYMIDMRVPHVRADVAATVNATALTVAKSIDRG